ncbi:LysR family transcriptional regulator [Rhodobacterales bacterium LSUCC0246]|nr:LysR family transcriptional regulator [Rhodobacterales bacterium LSUCC0374]
MNWDQHLNLRHVRTFLEIARAESVSLAADRLRITQPAVSRSLKELEQMLGVRLFDRVGRRLRLNEAGRVFQGHASASITELMRGAERLTADGELTTRLSIGVLPTAATDLLPRAALAFRKEMPHVRLQIQSGPNGLLFNQLRDGQVDLVVGRMPERDTRTGVTFQQLYIEDVVLVCRPGHPILLEPVPEQKVEGYTLILPPQGAVISQTVERYLSSIGLPEIRAAYETVALPVGRKLVRLSDALWFISHGVVADELKEGTLVAVALSSPLLSGPVGFSVARGAPINVERSVFAECLQFAASKQ